MKFLKNSNMHKAIMIKTLDDHLELDDYFYMKGKKEKRWSPWEKVDSEWEACFTAYSKRCIQKNSDLFERLSAKICREEDEESL